LFHFCDRPELAGRRRIEDEREIDSDLFDRPNGSVAIG